MSATLAIGIGCRRGCPAGSIAALVRDALARARQDCPARLFTLVDKAGEPGLQGAAQALGMDLVPLAREALMAVMPNVQTRSAVAEAAIGLSSVSEAAALAGAGAGARLLVARIAAGGATCAIAIGADV